MRSDFLSKISPNYWHKQVKNKYRQFLFFMVPICMNFQLPQFSLINHSPNNTARLSVPMIHQL